MGLPDSSRMVESWEKARLSSRWGSTSAGIVGGLGMFALVALTFRTLIQVRKQAVKVGDGELALFSGALLIALPGFLVQYIFDTAFEDFMYFFMLASISYVMLRMIQAQPVEKQLATT